MISKYSPPDANVVKSGDPLPGDDGLVFSPEAEGLWNAFKDHFEAIGIPLSAAQWIILWSGVVQWERGLNGNRSAASEASKTFKAFAITPDQLLLRQLAIREDSRAEERQAFLKEKKDSVSRLANPSGLTVMIEEGKV